MDGHPYPSIKTINRKIKICKMKIIFIIFIVAAHMCSLSLYQHFHHHTYTIQTQNVIHSTNTFASFFFFFVLKPDLGIQFIDTRHCSRLLKFQHASPAMLPSASPFDLHFKGTYQQVRPHTKYDFTFLRISCADPKHNIHKHCMHIRTVHKQIHRYV